MKLKKGVFISVLTVGLLYITNITSYANNAEGVDNKSDKSIYSNISNKNTRVKNGWVKENGKWYYLREDGQCVWGESIYINGKLYEFDMYGVCLNP